MQTDGDVLGRDLRRHLIVKRPPEAYIGYLGRHLLVDLLDRGPFTINFPAHVLPVNPTDPTGRADLAGGGNG
jgi:hypothetical protein